MTIQEGLLKILNTDDEPPSKRLKIADNAFKSTDVNIKNRELFLLKWLAQPEISNNNLEAWKQCHSWLSSDCFRELRSCDILDDELQLFLHSVEEQFHCKDMNLLSIMVSVVFSIIESTIFQHYFQVNLHNYLTFLRNIFEACSDEVILLKLFSRHDRIFSKKIIITPKFHIIFMDELFSCFVNILIKFSPTNNISFYEALLNVIQKNVFMKRRNEFEEFFAKLWENKQDESLNTELLDIFVRILIVSKKGNTFTAYSTHKILFHAFVKTYKQNMNLSYQLFAYLMPNLGFSCDKLKIPSNNSAQFDLTLCGLVAMLEVISTNNLIFDMKINELSFTDLLQNILLCIIDMTKSPINENCFQIIDLIIIISPLTIEANIGPLLAYLMCANNDEYASQYTKTICNIFDIFSKLHRLQNFISKIIRSLQPLYTEEHTQDEVILQGFSFTGKVSKSLKQKMAAMKGYLELDVSKMLPTVALEHFIIGTSRFASKQVTNLLKTFIFHLDELIAQDLAEKAKRASYVTCIELISTLLCNFLEKMNIVSSNLRAANMAEKLSKPLEETQIVLEKFGNALVGVEHNHQLMRIFLQLSYTWGELKILIQHAILNEDADVTNEVKDIELSACNIASLHSYLPSQTWCLIAERISNFGEQPCKKILETLWMQKIRFLILSGMETNTIKDHICALIKTITPIEEYYEYFLTDEFAAHVVLKELDAKSLLAIADCVLTDAIRDAAILKLVIQSRHFVSALVYAICRKINKLLKKEARAICCDFISCSVFEHIGENFLEETFDLDELNVKTVLRSALERCENSKANNKSVCLELLKGYLSLFKQLPIVFLDRTKQILIFYHFFAVFLDTRVEERGHSDVGNELENILLGIAQTKIVSIDAILPTQTMIKTVINNFHHYGDMCSNLLASSSLVGTNLNEALTLLIANLQDEKYLKALLVLTKYLQRHKKSSELMKELQENISALCTSLLPLLSNAHAPTSAMHSQILIELLQTNCIPITDDLHRETHKHLDRLFTKETNLVFEDLAFFHFMHTHDKLKPTNEDEQPFISKLANVLMCKVSLNEELLTPYAVNLKIVLQHTISIEEYKDFLSQILRSTLTSIQNSHLIKLELQMWEQIINLSLKPEKNEILQENIDELLLTVYKKIINETDDDVHDEILNAIIDFERRLLQNTQHLLTPTSLDLCFTTVTLRMQTAANNFEVSYNRSIGLLEVMLKYRQVLIHDRLPVFLQGYRLLLQALCVNSDTNKQHDDEHLERMAEHAHLLEKLTLNLCKLGVHIASIAIYLLADIIQQYESVTIYPAVKVALNNCINSLLALCNQHGIACLMRGLSPGSTQIFKLAYENYKKYHRFTGKV